MKTGQVQKKNMWDYNITLLEVVDQVSVVKTNGITRFEAYPDSFLKVII